MFHVFHILNIDMVWYCMSIDAHRCSMMLPIVPCNSLEAARGGALPLPSGRENGEAETAEKSKVRMWVKLVLNVFFNLLWGFCCLFVLEEYGRPRSEN